MPGSGAGGPAAPGHAEKAEGHPAFPMHASSGHYMNVIPPQRRREFARRAKRPFRVLSGGMRRLSRFARNLPQILAIKEFRKTLSGAFRPLASGITSPIGIVAILILTILTVGVPNWGLNKNSWPYYTFLACGTLFSVLLWKIPRKW